LIRFAVDLTFEKLSSAARCQTRRSLFLKRDTKIDDKQMKFVELKTEGLRCSRDGIITADGGL
jgi:hypothetical protein